MNEVVDRVPSQPGRYKMTMPDGSTQYVTLERADEPTVVGTPLNKALFDSIRDDLDELNSKTITALNSVGITSAFTADPSEWLSGGIYGFVLSKVQITSDFTYSPPTRVGTGEGNVAWWNVLTFGQPTRCTQVAFYGFEAARTSGLIYIRRKHDTDISQWVQVL